MWVKIEGWSQVSNVSSLSILLLRKSYLIFLRPRNRARVQAFCAIGSVHVSVPIWLAYSVHGWHCAAGPTWLLGPHGCYGENMQMKGASTGYWVRKRKKGLYLC